MSTIGARHELQTSTAAASDGRPPLIVGATLAPHVSAGAVRSREGVFETLPYLSSALKHIYPLRTPWEL